jgi:hypothetical protein
MRESATLPAPPPDDRGPARTDAWIATFTFLDVSGSISAAEWRRLVGWLSRLWRLAARSVLRRSRFRAVAF